MNIISSGKKEAKRIASIVSTSNKDVAQRFGLNAKNAAELLTFDHLPFDVLIMKHRL